MKKHLVQGMILSTLNRFVTQVQIPSPLFSAIRVEAIAARFAETETRLAR